MEKRYNYLGEDLGSKKPEYISLKYTKIVDGKRVPDWPEDDGVTIDGYGFDRNNTESNGDYKEEIELPKGTKICRYGGPTGYTTTLQNTSYDKLGLPYVKETIEYHEYEVVADGLVVKCVVIKGKTAKAFGSAGGAIQFVHLRTIRDELNIGSLKELTTWMMKE